LRRQPKSYEPGDLETWRASGADGEYRVRLAAAAKGQHVVAMTRDKGSGHRRVYQERFGKLSVAARVRRTSSPPSSRAAAEPRRIGLEASAIPAAGPDSRRMSPRKSPENRRESITRFRATNSRGGAPEANSL
jgi:hypothetical protein